MVPGPVRTRPVPKQLTLHPFPRKWSRTRSQWEHGHCFLQSADTSILMWKLGNPVADALWLVALWHGIHQNTLLKEGPCQGVIGCIMQFRSAQLRPMHSVSEQISLLDYTNPDPQPNPWSQERVQSIEFKTSNQSLAFIWRGAHQLHIC